MTLQNSTIFNREGPRYRERNIPVIPLQPRTKKPVPDGWSDYAEFDISEATWNEWMNYPANHNIGLVLGPKSGISVLDIDTNNAVIIDAVLKALPDSPWHRVGATGLVLAFRYNPSVRTFRLDAEQDGRIIEFLARDIQVVLPPSIHPDTNRPYTANVDLLDVYDQLPDVPVDIEDIIHEVLAANGVVLKTKKGVGSLIEFIPAGARDTTITQRAGLLAHEILEGRITLLRAFDSLDVIYNDFTQQVEGDGMDMHKHKRNLVKFLMQDMAKSQRSLPLGWDEGLNEDEITKLGLQDASVEWAYDEIRDYIEVQMDNTNDEKHMEIIRFAVRKLAEVATIDSLRESDLFNWMVKRTKVAITARDLKSEVQRLREELTNTIQNEGEVIELTSHTTVARAAILELTKVSPLCSEDGLLYRWMGSHWEAFHLSDLKLFVANRYCDLPIAKRSSDIDGICKQIIVLSHGKLRKDFRNYINTANGVILEDGKFLQHHPDFGATYVLPYRYMPALADQKPLFDKFLDDAWGHNADFAEKCQALQEAICVSCLGIATKYQRAFLLLGMPNSGKSVLLSIIDSLFPDSAKAAVPFTKWHDNSQLTSLHKKLINIVGEGSDKAKIEGATFKLMIDGTKTSARYLFAEAFSMQPIAAHWLASNHLPKSTDSSKGFIRRWLMFEFDKAVPDDLVDINLPGKIITQEREAIFAWALQALPRLLDGKRLTLPASHHGLSEELAHQNNPVLLFLKKDPALEFGPEHSISEVELHHRFRFYFFHTCGAKRTIDLQEFRSMLKEIKSVFGITDFQKEGELGNHYLGIGVNDD